MPKLNKGRLLEVLSPLIGFFVAMLLLLIIVLILGKTPGEALNAMIRATAGTPSRFGSLLSRMVPLYIAGVAVAIAFRAGVFNIGVEGQYFIGGLVGALAGIYLRLPAFLHVPLVVIAAGVGGALWASVPALLKVRRGAHEVITTIMFNYIAIGLANYLVNGPLSGLEGSQSLAPQTRDIAETALFDKINGFFRAIGLAVQDHVHLDYSLIVAVLVGIVAFVFLFKTRQGFEVRSVGEAIDASRNAGMMPDKVQLMAFLMSGGIAGLIGLQEIFGIKGHYTFEIAAGVGFDGIAIALIGRNNPLGIVFAAFLFAFLRQAGYGLQLIGVTNSVSYVVSGLMILIIVVTNEVITRYLNTARKKEVAA